MKSPKSAGSQISAPKLFIHSRDDSVVPFMSAEKLYNESSGEKRIVEIRGDHNAGFIESKEAFLEAIHQFVSKISESANESSN